MTRSRVVEYIEVPPSQLTAHPANAKYHGTRQRDVMRALLDDVGWVAPIIENVTTGYVIDGHMRVEEALSTGVARVPVIRVELTEAEEAEVLVTFDGVGQLARWEQDRLNDLIAGLDAEGPVADLLADLSDMAITVSTAELPDVSDLAPDEVGSGEMRSLCAVYPLDRYIDTVEALRHVPGDSVGQKLTFLLDRYT